MSHRRLELSPTAGEKVSSISNEYRSARTSSWASFFDLYTLHRVDNHSLSNCDC